MARKAIAAAVLLLALVPAARLAWMAREMPHFGHLHDDSIYYVTAKSLAEGPTLALRYMKDNLDEALLFDFATARDHEAERLIRLTTTADHREAVQAFIDKRKAAFKGD